MKFKKIFELQPSREEAGAKTCSRVKGYEDFPNGLLQKGFKMVLNGFDDNKPILETMRNQLLVDLYILI